MISTENFFLSNPFRVMLLMLLDLLVPFGSVNLIAGEPVTIQKGQSQLFLDDTLITSKHNITRRWHQLEKHPSNPLIERSGLEKCTVFFGSAIREPDPTNPEKKIFRMWYWAAGFDEKENWHTWIAYAKSRDGFNWEKPDIGIHRFHGNKNNNIVFTDWLKINNIALKRLNGLAGVIRDPNPDVPKNQRYKMVIQAMPETGRDLYDRWHITLTSPYGLHWQVHKVLESTTGDRTCFVYDPYRKLYALYLRAYHSPPKYKERAIEQKWAKFYSGNARAVALMTSKDFQNWTEPELLMYPDSNDPDGTQIYGLYAFPYEGKWVGLWQNHRSLRDVATINFGIAYSHNGTNWKRIRATEHIILPLGEIGEWDRFNQAGASNLLRIGDKLWYYYSGRTYRHNEYEGNDNGPRGSQGAIRFGLATLRLDGFCSLEASFDGGYIVTTTVTLPESELFINAKADFGKVTVELLDEDGNLIDNMKSQPIQADGVRLQVQWPEGKSLKDSVSKTIRLKFTLENARLYSWKVE